MKKLLTVVFTMLLAGSLSFGQGTAGDPGTRKVETPKNTVSGKKATKTKKGHKGGKKELNPQPLPPKPPAPNQTAK